MKKNKVAISVFLVLALFNLLFPPFVIEGTGNYIITRKHFTFVFKDLVKSVEPVGTIDIKTSIILLLISLVISFIIQMIYNFFKGRKQTIIKADEQ